MPVPSYDHFIEPVLRFLAAHADGIAAGAAHEAAADALGLTTLDRQERVPSGIQALYKNRAGWAHDRLKRAGMSSSPKHGVWRLTPAGVAYVKAHATPLSHDEVAALADVDPNLRLRNLSPKPELVTVAGAPPVVVVQSPDDRLYAALQQIRDAVRQELLTTLHQVHPAFFERLVLDVLLKMGYGADASDLQRVGGVGDGGIDGVISLDKLGLEKVYVQAKRWQGPVGRPDVQGFFGALQGHRSKKGIMITTSSFTGQAYDYQKTVDGLVLVDGRRLADLMIDYQVGVASKPVQIPAVDSDYFDQ